MFVLDFVGASPHPCQPRVPSWPSTPCPARSPRHFRFQFMCLRMIVSNASLNSGTRPNFLLCVFFVYKKKQQLRSRTILRQLASNRPQAKQGSTRADQENVRRSDCIYVWIEDALFITIVCVRKRTVWLGCPPARRRRRFASSMNRTLLRGASQLH